MPGGDRTGPLGAGPMTGRGAGFCANQPGFMTGGGFGRGMGMGRGFRNRCFSGGWSILQTPQPISKADQVAALKAQADRIQQQIDALEENA